MTRRRFSLLALVPATLLAGCGSGGSGDQSAATPAMDNVSLPPTANVTELPAPQRRTREQLREQARTDPDGADAQAISQMSRNELVATSINSAGFLCARVTDLYMRGDDMIAHCVEYRSGSGRVTYRINPASSSVEQID